MKKISRTNSGFTIVELLIVIVVIGILAAIVIVAFNGVQNRAQQASYKTAANSIIKKAEIYRATHSSYPTFTHLSTTDFYTGDASPDKAAQIEGGIVVFYYDDVTAGSSLSTTNPYNYATIKSAADGIYTGLPQKSYAAGKCGTGAGTGFKVLYPDPTTKANVMITTGTGC